MRLNLPVPVISGSSLTDLRVTTEWDVQSIIEHLVRSLQTRGYDTWFDVDQMKGSTMDVRKGHALTFFSIELSSI